MRYRANLIGGVLHIGPAEKKGTLVTCTLPAWRRNNA
jgi:signal transduction histidine kinase